MKYSALHVFFLGLISLLGGVDGFLSAGSVISLIAGGIIGIILLVSTVLMLQERDSGWYLGFFTTFVVLVKFASEFQYTGDLYPAGLLAAISVWVIGALIVNRIERHHSAAHS